MVLQLLNSEALCLGEKTLTSFQALCRCDNSTCEYRDEDIEKLKEPPERIVLDHPESKYYTVCYSLDGSTAARYRYIC